MKSKPAITAKLSAVSSVFQPAEVAKDIVTGSALGYFGIATGLDGWMLKQVHPGMSPVHNAWEVLSQILFAPLCRLIAVFYLLYFDQVCEEEKGTATAATASAAPDAGASAKVTATATATGVRSPDPAFKRASISKDR